MVIGVTDSGIGGLWLLSALIKKFPNERYIYYSDNRFAPYGNRNGDFLADRFYSVTNELKKAGAHLAVVGCNTMGVTLGLTDAVKAPIPVAWIYPEAYPEKEDTLIMTTPLSARSDYVGALRSRGAEILCDGALAAMAEEAGGCSEEIEKRLKGMAALNKKRTAVALGCTHYLYFRKAVTDLCGAVKIYDGVRGAVRRAARYITDTEPYSLEWRFSGADESEKYIKVYSETVKNCGKRG